jgi:hypothetical protein
VLVMTVLMVKKCVVTVVTRITSSLPCRQAQTPTHAQTAAAAKGARECSLNTPPPLLPTQPTKSTHPTVHHHHHHYRHHHHHHAPTVANRLVVRRLLSHRRDDKLALLHETAGVAEADKVCLRQAVWQPHTPSGGGCSSQSRHVGGVSLEGAATVARRAAIPERVSKRRNE